MMFEILHCWRLKRALLQKWNANWFFITVDQSKCFQDNYWGYFVHL